MGYYIDSIWGQEACSCDRRIDLLQFLSKNERTWIMIVFLLQPDLQFSFMLISDNKCKISQINKPTYMLVRGILVCLVPGGLVLNNTSPGHSKVILVQVLFFVNKRAQVNHLRLWGALYSHKVLQVAITRHTIGEYEYNDKVYKYYSVLFWHNFSEFRSSKVLFHLKIIIDHLSWILTHAGEVTN